MKAKYVLLWWLGITAFVFIAYAIFEPIYNHFSYLQPGVYPMIGRISGIDLTGKPEYVSLSLENSQGVPICIDNGYSEFCRIIVQASDISAIHLGQTATVECTLGQYQPYAFQQIDCRLLSIK